MKRILLALLACVMAAFGCVASSGDMERVGELLRAHSSDVPQSRVTSIAREFLGAPYVGATLEWDTEQLRYNLSEFDCTTFVETVLAMALTVADGGSAEEFIRNLESVRYRAGHIDGYCSRLHYISDWAMENEARGHLADVTHTIPGAVSQTLELNYMSVHRQSYPALADDGVFACIQGMERSVSPITYMLVPKHKAGLRNVGEALRDGDIVAFATSTPGLDVSHIGIVLKGPDGIPRLLHASSAAGKVIIDPKPLALYVRSRPSLTGMRIFRIAD